MAATLGRPPLPHGTGRTERTVTFLTKGEHDELARQAALGSMSLSAFCHRLIADGLKRNPIHKEGDTK